MDGQGNTLFRQSELCDAAANLDNSHQSALAHLHLTVQRLPRTAQGPLGLPGSYAIPKSLTDRHVCTDLGTPV